MSKEEDCESADKNPVCPYVTQINNFNGKISVIDGKVQAVDSRVDEVNEKYSKFQTSMAGLKTDVGWLKKGYWVQIGILLALMGLVISLFGRGG
jgi:hypothetical protein